MTSDCLLLPLFAKSPTSELRRGGASGERAPVETRAVLLGVSSPLPGVSHLRQRASTAPSFPGATATYPCHLLHNNPTARNHDICFLNMPVRQAPVPFRYTSSATLSSLTPSPSFSSLPPRIHPHHKKIPPKIACLLAIQNARGRSQAVPAPPLNWTQTSKDLINLKLEV